jgi:hypothetical protein
MLLVCIICTWPTSNRSWFRLFNSILRPPTHSLSLSLSLSLSFPLSLDTIHGEETNRGRHLDGNTFLVRDKPHTTRKMMIAMMMMMVMVMVMMPLYLLSVALI